MAIAAQRRDGGGLSGAARRGALAWLLRRPKSFLFRLEMEIKCAKANKGESVLNEEELSCQLSL